MRFRTKNELKTMAESSPFRFENNLKKRTHTQEKALNVNFLRDILKIAMRSLSMDLTLARGIRDFTDRHPKQFYA